MTMDCLSGEGLVKTRCMTPSCFCLRLLVGRLGCCCLHTVDPANSFYVLLLCFVLAFNVWARIGVKNEQECSHRRFLCTQTTYKLSPLSQSPSLVPTFHTVHPTAIFLTEIMTALNLSSYEDSLADPSVPHRPVCLRHSPFSTVLYVSTQNVENQHEVLMGDVSSEELSE